ncbi:MarR family winged helix-turn-helix transcriptional regulator [Bradyrhizobium elkanii]|uniref:MarR family winged helix-turn-helix transcriptional regulator n=1 Tax=Bradyrhizobium elkanii TaxID=29448 RepID=UPI0020A07D86|nr:MarR family winged helix-turn-helix transcriptional regulator [Bradyrhizobium elkanii]MCP1967352.1 DNA-binding MarR family transcriptional regulator [Bradyrhizobium elkanii]MCS4111143.1 DNA-binding MarR family transcriptional regulator [Bradyrhizobium elkanii]MCW2123602.1 DNA-binding MarR family transcriptional regulator [Bradyrhizobium elkanii]MCW2170349.1 DNA-binding MarR family transcriptional regulator [Bradyrhizobium elkanii]
MSEQSDWPPTPDDRALLIRMLNAVNILYSMDHRISTQLARTFLRVAEDEHQTVASLASKCGISAAVMTRHLQNLGSVNRNGNPGLGLVEMVEGLYDRRERRAILTERGAQAARLIYETLVEPKPVLRRRPRTDRTPED